MATLDQFLIEMLNRKGSDLHLSINQPAKIRVYGRLEALTEDIVSQDFMEMMLREICPDVRWDHYIEDHDLDFAYEIEGVARFRTNYLYNYNGMAAVFRQIPSKIQTLEELNLPPVLKSICCFTSGLVCVTGPTGSGKSTTMAAMIDYINENYSRHIITIEDPIEFVHKNKLSTIVHREVGIHSGSFAKALKGAMKSDPDILLLGEMRDMETISLALTCASMGMLVFATLHTNNAPKTIDRIIDAFPADEQAQIRTMLAESLQGVISQLLCRTTDGRGRVAVHEILLWTEGLPNTIREGQISNIRTIIESNRGKGMCSMDSCLYDLMNAGKITAEEAYMKATDKKRFLEFLPERAALKDK
ncbi:MAG: type IV pili twitching motility protein PilT [Lentisphaerae bacterium GWF2_45_14]|nr:MAG: type IV pili twitching motility protein PilT [Lentisphaerae bacterium GWF2_45_14]